MVERTIQRVSGTPPAARQRRGGRQGDRPTDREVLVSGAAEHLRDGTTVVVLGVPGSGRSFLASRVVEDVVRTADVPVLAVRSATSARALTVTTLHDPDDPDAAGTVRHLPSGTAAPGGATLGDALVGGRVRPVVLADDAHHLDPEHLELLCRLVEDARVVLLATTDTAPTAHPDHADAVARLTRLWLDSRSERVDLPALTTAEAHDLVLSTADGHPLDATVRHAILLASGGSPVTVGELTRDAVASDGSGVLDLLALTCSTHLPLRAVERARRRLAGLGPAERDGLVLLARLGAVTAERGARYVGDTTLRRLVQHGCVTSDGATPAVLRATPVDAEGVLADRGSHPEQGVGDQAAGLSPTHARALRTMVELDAAGLTLDPLECLLLSDAWLDDGPDVTPGVAPDQVARVAAVAAQKSLAMLRPYRALSHAVLSLDSGPSVAGAVAASRALAALGDLTAAQKVLGRAPDAGARDDVDLLHLWRARLDSLAGSGRADGGPEPTPARPTPAVDALLRATQAAHALRWRSALDDAGPLVDDEHAGVVVRLRAAGLASLCAAFLGDGATLAHVTAAGRRLHATLADASGSARSQTAVDEGTAFVTTSLAAHAVCGVGWTELPQEVDRLVRQAVAARDLAHTGALSGLAGYLALCSGDYGAAVRELDAARDRLPEPTPEPLRAWVRALRTTALTRAGLPLDEDDLGSSEHAAPWARFFDEAQRHGAGDDQPTLTLLVAAESAITDPAPPPPYLAAAARAARERTDLLSLRAVADYVVAAAEDDTDALADLTRVFDGLGFRQLAQACEHQAARVLDPDSQQSWTAWRDRAARPAPGPTGTDEPLTAREREIATLAGRGLSNKEIARRLFLSVRTVESHVYLARRKLGAASRHDLG